MTSYLDSFWNLLTFTTRKIIELYKCLFLEVYGNEKGMQEVKNFTIFWQFKFW